MNAVLVDRTSRLTLTLTLTLAVTACGGDPTESASVSPPDAKAQAAATTAQTNPACTSLTAFYWEIGDASSKLASGTVGANPPAANTLMSVASSSKWLYAAYAVEKRGNAGVSATADVPYLNFTSGYSNFGIPACPGVGGTIDDCLNEKSDIFDQTTVGRFAYDSAHMQKHASLSGAGNLTATTLASDVARVLFPNETLTLRYTDAQPAASGQTTTQDYARFLRKMMGPQPALRIGSLLGSNAVCTLPGVCPTAASSPAKTQDWHYSLGHWVEDDAATVQSGNVAYSSAGAFGFYPWISQDRTLYGVLARENPGTLQQQGFLSSVCGGLIRKAYVTGLVQ